MNRLTGPQLAATIVALGQALEPDGLWYRTVDGPGPFDVRVVPAYPGAERQARAARNALRTLTREYIRRPRSDQAPDP